MFKNLSFISLFSCLAINHKIAILMNNLHSLIKTELPRIFDTKQFDLLIKTRTHHKHSLHLLQELVKRGKITHYGAGLYKTA